MSETNEGEPLVETPPAEPIDQVEKVNREYESYEENRKIQNIMIFNSIFYLIIFILIGLPIWYLTSTTYRASLPFDEIDEVISSMHNGRIDMKFKMELVDFDSSVTNEQLKVFEKQIVKELAKQSAPGIATEIELSMRKPNAFELAQLESKKQLNELDEILIISDKPNLLRCFAFDEETSNSFKLNNDFHILHHVFFKHELLKDEKKFASFVKTELLNLKHLSDTFETKLSSMRKIPKKEELNVLNFDSSYEITFSFIHSNEKFIDYDMKTYIERYFGKIINQLSSFLTFKLKSQSLLFSDFDAFKILKSPKQSDGTTYNYIRPTDLSVMTNFIESRLSSRITNSTGLDFIVYSPSQQPLYIVTNENTPNEKRSNSFLVPRWGSIYICNHLGNDMPVNEAMKIFLTDFIGLIGIKVNKNLLNITRSRIYSSEIYNFLASKTLENVLNSMSTLRSISSLLNKISNMVIRDDIASEIILTLESIKKSISELKKGNVHEAFYSSKIAYKSSEKAFFDPSLLEKLYFPEDQTFAIYIPLFIPVAIPLLLSVKSIAARFKRKVE